MPISQETQDKIDRFHAIRRLLTPEELQALTNLGDFLNDLPAGWKNETVDAGLTVIVAMFDPEGLAEDDPGFTEAP